jgi:hypothetical protein
MAIRRRLEDRSVFASSSNCGIMVQGLLGRALGAGFVDGKYRSDAGKGSPPSVRGAPLLHDRPTPCSG